MSIAPKRIHVFLFLLMVGSLVVSACKKTASEPAQFFYNYYPTAVGTWVVYDVDSMYHDNLQSDTFHFQIMEVVAETFTDDQGRATQRIERFHRVADTTSWVLRDVWFSNRTATTAEKVEENRRYVKLIFPVRRNDDWNGNAYNIEDELEYNYEEAHEPYQLGTLAFDSTATILQAMNNNLVDTFHQYEVYAAGVGMVERFYRDLYYGDTQIPIIGTEFYYTAVDYGQ